jgi:hypothetical protein
MALRWLLHLRCLWAWFCPVSDSERAANAHTRADMVFPFFCFFGPPFVGCDLGPILGGGMGCVLEEGLLVPPTLSVPRLVVVEVEIVNG